LFTVNIGLLFVLGQRGFAYFMMAIKDQITNPTIWVGNHSIHSYVQIQSQAFAWNNGSSGLVQWALLAMLAFCIFFIMLKAYRQKQSGINSFLLLACTIGALLIPSASNDYTLSILAAPIAILFSGLFASPESTIRPPQRFIFTALVFILSVAYSSTLFPYTNKPFFLQNNCPALFVMLLTITCLSVMSKPGLEGQVSDSMIASDKMGLSIDIKTPIDIK
jgi:hypothetical protein